jgi:hypothetical protein
MGAWKLVLTASLLLVVIWLFVYFDAATKTRTPQTLKIVDRNSHSNTATPPARPLPTASEELGSFYTPAVKNVPIDDSMCKESCPFGKPMSTDLPIVNMPRCQLLASKTSKMSEMSLKK